MNTYPVDTLVQINGTFVSVTNQQPVDPSTITLSIIFPDLSVNTFSEATTPAVNRTGVGTYYLQFQILEQGTYIYRWQGLGAVIAASRDGFIRGI